MEHGAVIDFAALPEGEPQPPGELDAQRRHHKGVGHGGLAAEVDRVDQHAQVLVRLGRGDVEAFEQRVQLALVLPALEVLQQAVLLLDL